MVGRDRAAAAAARGRLTGVVMLGDKAAASRLSMRAFLFSVAVSAAFATAQSPDADHYKLEIELDFAGHTIQGTCTATFTSTSPALQTVSLDLAAALTVTGVEMGGSPTSWTRSGDTVLIALDQPYGVGQPFTVKIGYGGAPAPSPGFGGLQFVTTPGGRPCAWTLSEPWDARTWWPGKDQLDDKATFEIWITHPATMAAVSNGLLQGTDALPGNRARSRWQTNYPMAAYLASFVCTEWSVRTDTYTGFGAAMPVQFYVFPESFAAWTPGMDRVVPMLNALSSVFGQYPFVAEKYGVAQFTWSGGMEHQTLASQSSVVEAVTAHELAHQWWGDMITCATWSDVWLNEGFATFSEAIWAERKQGGTFADYQSAMIARKPMTTAGTVYVYSPTSVANVFSTTNVYRKGAWVLHMLRGVLGDAAFFQALLDYRAAYAGGSATTAQFAAAVEQSAGRDLGWFFAEWVMNPGSPAWSFAWANRTVAGANHLYLELDQTQTSQNVFTMPVRVRVSTTAGVIEATVWNDERADQLVIPLPAPAFAVTIDPDQWILRGTPTARPYTTPFFGADGTSIDTAAGGSVELHLDLGAASAGRPYFVVVGMSGSSPPWTLAGLQIPVALDAMTMLGIEAANTPVFADFFGVVAQNGTARATFAVPPAVAAPLAGTTITASAVRIDAFDFASRPVAILLR